MAERRSLHGKVSHSTDMVDLIDAHGPYAALFVTWAIPHLDRYGCLPDDARKLRGIVLPLVEGVSNAQVGEWVEWLVDRGMVARVKGPNGDQGIQFTSFHKLQGNARWDRERPSPYEPAGWLGDATDQERVRAADRMRNHRARRKESAELQGTPGEPMENDGSYPGVISHKRREEKLREEPPTPFLMGGERLENGRRRGSPEDGAWAVVARAAAMDREETNGEHNTE